jgi:hypothetical protein
MTTAYHGKLTHGKYSHTNNAITSAYHPKDTSRIIIIEKPTIVAIVTKSMFL